MFGNKKKSSPASSSKSRAPARQPQSQKNMPPALSGGQGGGMMSGLGGAVVQGAAFGAGSGLAHRAVDSVLGPRTVEHVHNDVDGSMEGGEMAADQDNQQGFNENQACRFEVSDFNQCMQENPGDLGKCKFFYDVLTQCQSNASGWQ